jgi:uncharacterized peroxidase-related enzyme
MQRIRALDAAAAPTASQPLLAAVQQKLGVTPNLFKTLAHSTAGLQSYLQQSQALAAGVLPPKVREQIALVTAGANGCDYCASAHTLLGKGVGVSAEEAAQNLRGVASDARTQAALKFARAIVETRGNVTESQLASVRDAGYSDAEIVEIVAHVAMNIFTNYFNHVAGTEVDFPFVKAAA